MEKTGDFNVESSVGETANKAIYSSRTFMNRELFFDFQKIGYHKSKIIYLIFMCMVIWQVVMNVAFRYYDMLFYILFLSMLMIFLYIGKNRTASINYRRMLLTEVKEEIRYQEFFEDKIVLHHEGLQREFFYTHITGFYETKYFLLLHLQHQLYIHINKDMVNGNVDEVKEFLMERCPFVKKKKFISCRNDKKWTRVFLIISVAVSVIGMIIGVVLKLRESFG